MQSSKETIRGFKPPIEAMVETDDPIRILGIEPFPDNSTDLAEVIDTYGRMLDDHEFLAVHETSKGNAEQIEANGFNRSFPRTTEESTLRANATFFWIHESDIGQRPPDDGEHYLVFCGLADGHVFVSSYGSINRYVDGDPEEYEENELIFSHTYRKWVKRGVTPSDEHDAETLLPGGE